MATLLVREELGKGDGKDESKEEVSKEHGNKPLEDNFEHLIMCRRISFHNLVKNDYRVTS